MADPAENLSADDLLPLAKKLPRGEQLRLAHTLLETETPAGDLLAKRRAGLGRYAGRGWIAVALVIFAGWNPYRAVIGAYLFGGVEAGQFRLQSVGVGISPFFLVRPAKTETHWKQFRRFIPAINIIGHTGRA